MFAYHYDVTNDGRFNTSDVLAVINHILLDAETSAPTALAEPFVADPRTATIAPAKQSPLNWIAFAAAIAEADDKDHAEFW